jgi:DNA repair protein RadC
MRKQHPENTIPNGLKTITKKLQRVDRQLEELTGLIPVDSDGALPRELRGDIEVVRTDFLADAIETLADLTQLDEESATRRYLKAADRLERAGHQITAERPQLGRPEAIVEYLIARHSCLDQEIMGAVYVDTQQRLIADVEIFRGTLVRTAVEPRVVLRQALERGAAGFVMWHTHPSGNPSPTPEDVGFTRRLAESAQLLGIRLYDHLILGESGHWVSLERGGGWSLEIEQNLRKIDCKETRDHRNQARRLLATAPRKIAQSPREIAAGAALSTGEKPAWRACPALLPFVLMPLILIHLRKNKS